MTLIEQIALLIDNDQALQDKFLSHAESITDLVELGDIYYQLLSDYLEDGHITVTVGSDVSPHNRVSFKPVVNLYEGILCHVIDSISEQEWQWLAQHYLTIAGESRQ